MIFQVIHKDNATKYMLFGIPVWRVNKNAKGSYGIKSIMLDYSGVKFNPDRVRIQHGWTPIDGAIPTEVAKDNMDVMFSWNKRYKEDWDKKSKVPCYVWGAPFVYYRKMANVEQNSDAKGTLAFPSHSTKASKSEFDIDAYCDELKALPEEFQPVTISLHPLDIDLYQMDKEYEKRGFKTFCAGMDKTRPFYEVFYDNLRKYKYTTSNVPGSYTFYAVEMGIPFFMLGELPIEDNRNGADKNIGIGVFKMTDCKYGKITCDLFSGQDKHVITSEQKDFVMSEMGVNDSISKEELIKILENIK